MVCIDMVPFYKKGARASVGFGAAILEPILPGF